jgi:hypothetical protein
MTEGLRALKRHLARHVHRLFTTIHSRDDQPRLNVGTAPPAPCLTWEPTGLGYGRTRLPTTTGTVREMTWLGFIAPVALGMMLAALTFLFALLGNRLNLVLSLGAGAAAAIATANASIPYLSDALHGLLCFLALGAGFQLAAVLSLGLGSLAAPRVGRDSWVNGDPDRPQADLLVIRRS